MTEMISKSRLKAKMLEKFRKVESNGEELIVTDHGRPVLKIVPIKQHLTIADIFTGLQGNFIYLDDNNQPPVNEWGEV